MCGFCGIYTPGVEGSFEQVLEKMTDTIAHRGPDDSGLYHDNDIGLGHRRLSIMDLSAHGAQPMTLEQSGITIAFNGEVYNFKELRKNLEGLGHQFHSQSDTEVMLHCYDQWGLEGLTQLEGMFAFALWDAPKNRLVLMRDRFGIKPLFYSESNGKLIFGSEIKALLASGEINREVDQQALSEYLWYGNAYEDRTIYRDVQALQPGHWLIVENGHSWIEQWWKLEDWLSQKQLFSSADEAAEAVKSALDKAVSRQLVADVPVGIFLSGGVDSSAIAASAMAVQGTPLKSFSVGFDFDKGVNELPKARRVADHLGLDHHELRVSGADMPDIVQKMVRAHDEPFADAANIPLYLLSQAVEGKVKVVLQGDGGDEMFAGYRRYAMLRHAQIWNKWPHILTPAVRKMFGRFGKRLARMTDAVGANNATERMALLMTMETLNDPPTRLLTKDKREQLALNTDPFLSYRNCAQRFAEHDPVQQMLLTDISLQLPSQFLTKVDRSTMAQSMEVRVPLLDENIGRLAVGMPSKWKVQGAKNKIALRRSMRERLPADIFDGPKTGFGVPYGYWLKTSLHEMARDVILGSDFTQKLGFDRDKLESALKQHKVGQGHDGFTLWKIFQLALWHSEYK